MKFVMTEIVDIIAKQQHNEKYQSVAFPSMKFSREKIRHLTLILAKCSNEHYYLFRFEDGRKASSLYVGKQIWGEEEGSVMYSGLFSEYSPIYRLESYWESKEKFLNRVKNRITRNEEGIINLTQQNDELRKLL